MAQNLALLEDHVVLVTGGGSGLGLGVARRCRDHGAGLAIMEIMPEKSAALRSEFGGDALIVEGDCSYIADLQACEAAIRERYGKLDALIGVQGIFDASVPVAEIAPDKLDALFDELFRVNVKGHLLAARIFRPLLEQSGGAIVLTSSTAAYAADGGGAVYTATKGAILALIQQLAFEFAPHIRVNGVAPAGIARSQLRGPASLGMEGFKQSDIPEDAFLAKFRSISLLQELPEGEDYALPYIFLASKQNLIVTGQTWVADQGLLNRAVLSDK
jgi:NAD(P)-dependent dehydrogenase (short-subunit alcohol dehydrogenase family)